LTDYIIDRGKKLYQLKSNEIKILDNILPDNWSKNNPIDIIGDALSNRYDACLKVVDGIVDVDLIYVIVTPQFMTDAVAIAKVIEKYRNKKTLIPIFLGGELLKEAKEYFEQKQIPYFSTLHEATAFL
jgi:acyl-CoA synthetase (NDP forming)